MRAVLEIGERIECAQSSRGGVEREIVAEVVVAQKRRVLAVNDPVHAGVEELPVQQSWSGLQKAGVDSQRGGVGRSDGNRRWIAASQVLVGTKPEQLVLDGRSTDVGGVIVQS